MAEQKSSNVTLCPDCDSPLQLSGKLHIGQRLSCRRCGSTFVIAERRPLELVPDNNRRKSTIRADGDRSLPKDKTTSKTSNHKNNEPEEDPVMSTKSRVLMAECPECDSRLRFRMPLKIGQLVVCPECEETLEVILLDPLELDWADEDPWDSDGYSDFRFSSDYRKG